MHRHLIIAALAATTVLAGCGKKEQAEPRKTPVGVEAVRVHDGSLALRYSANLQPYDQVDLAFRASGYVEHILQVRGADQRLRPIQDGDHTSRGQLLAALRSTDYSARLQEAQAGLADARARLNRAEQDFGRASRLFAAQSMTRPDFDAASAAYESSRASLEASEERKQQAAVTLRDTQLVSPLNGVVVKRNVTAGTLAGPSAPAFTVADISSMKAVFGVPDVVVARMKPGDTLQLTTDAFPDEKFTGRITRVSAAADPRSRVFEVEVTLPNADERLRIGMIASLMVTEQRAAGPMTVVPLSAVVGAGTSGKYAVFAVEEKDAKRTARRHEVELGETFGNDVAIVNGLRAGDKVVTVGANLITDGEPIEVVATAAKLVR